MKLLSQNGENIDCFFFIFFLFLQIRTNIRFNFFFFLNHIYPKASFIFNFHANKNMASIIYYKFKNTKSGMLKKVTFTGKDLAVSTMKDTIISQNGLDQQRRGALDCDLVMTNAHTGEEYADASGTILSCSTLIVKRVPLYQTTTITVNIS